jgi:hypothetical protein
VGLGSGKIIKEGSKGQAIRGQGKGMEFEPCPAHWQQEYELILPTAGTSFHIPWFSSKDWS